MAEPLSLEMHDQHAAALEQQQNPLDTLRAAFETTAEQLNNQRDILKAANTILRLRGADAHVQGIAAEAATQISTLRPRVIDDEIRYRQTEMTQLEPRVLPVIAEDERLAFIDNHLKANEVRLDSPVYNAIQTELGRHPTRADLEKMKADILSRRAKEKNEIEEKLADATIVRYMETDGKKAGARFMGRSGSAEIRAHIDAPRKVAAWATAH